MSLYQLFFRHVLLRFPAEPVHRAALVALRVLGAVPPLLALVRRWLRPRRPELEVSALGLRFSSPLGMAAGFDKDATCYEPLAALGFGFVEVGTVTGEAQPGNPEPRLFRLPEDRALVNRMGFNNHGSAAMAPRLRGARTAPLGVNIGKTKVVPLETATDDYIASAERLGALADYFVVNVSSPNTPGLRELQGAERLRPILAGVQQALARVSPARTVPLLVKIAPDLADEDVDEVVDLAVELGLAGLIIANTTIRRDGLRSAPEVVDACGAGGLSGPPLKARSLRLLRRVAERAAGRLTLVSVGGVETVEDVWERLVAGASLVQVYTAFIYAGPFFAHELNRRLALRLRSRGLRSLGELRAGAR